MNYNSEVEYLALPYTHEDESVMDYRASVSDRVAAKLTNEGRLVYAPISQWHHIAKLYRLPTNYEYWKRLNRDILKNCNRLLIITLPGWQDSTGVAYEIEVATEFKIPMTLIEYKETISEVYN